MREYELRAALNIWGPIKMIINKQAHELWGKVPSEAIRAAFTTIRRKEDRNRRSSSPVRQRDNETAT